MQEFRNSHTPSTSRREPPGETDKSCLMRQMTRTARAGIEWQLGEGDCHVQGLTESTTKVEGQVAAKGSRQKMTST
ncbi:hypothetical protein JAAARDRAFT_33412 [Jaapia argillacea MUCL 33604]|uniref:Uncharacterized protein n=1 Tax=Jaapia argillacea MUCL 33604 TaxID=933084 RepID=A0A067PYE9_9AGAM|nr:hypothetical protein JAAARDRAFT_33412 [Jaapia argillacea MUCL 33604]